MFAGSFVAHTALTVCWPGVTKQGSRTAALVQYADLVPTLIEIGGGRFDPQQFDGQSFIDVLRGKADQHRHCRQQEQRMSLDKVEFLYANTVSNRRTCRKRHQEATQH